MDRERSDDADCVEVAKGMGAKSLCGVRSQEAERP